MAKIKARKSYIWFVMFKPFHIVKMSKHVKELISYCVNAAYWIWH